MLSIETPRLRLVAATEELSVAELENRGRFGELLGAIVPEVWPPETLRDVQSLFLELLRRHPDWYGWLVWYAILTDGEESVLCGSIGFKGPADGNGMVEIGYSVLPAFQGCGIATEMAQALIRWAGRAPHIRCVEAETMHDNLISQRVLEKLGFVSIGIGREEGTVRFRRERPLLQQAGIPEWITGVSNASDE